MNVETVGGKTTRIFHMRNEIKNYQSLYTSVQTIQLEVDMMDRSTSGKSKVAKKGQRRGRNGTMTTGSRPSRARRVEAVEGSCEVCGSTSWDSDDVRGETVCSECGYVASENMIDPGAEWVNHSNGDDRSRVGAPTTLTLSDKKPFD